jgi:hypothetical protein
MSFIYYVYVAIGNKESATAGLLTPSPLWEVTLGGIKNNALFQSVLQPVQP